MKKILILLTGVIIFIFQSNVQAQTNVSDSRYDFKLSLPSGWSKSGSEETSNKDAISYSFDKSDGKNAIMLLAFKVNTPKNLEDLIYTLEKDVTLNIPSRSGSFTSIDVAGMEGKKATYKDDNFVETIYYFSTDDPGNDNYAYMLRFITASSYFNSGVESEIDDIVNSFRRN